MPVPKVSVLHLAEIVVAEKLLNFDEIAQVAAGIGVQSDAMDDICTEAVFTFPQGIFSPPKSPVNTCHFRKSTFLTKCDTFWQILQKAKQLFTTVLHSASELI